MLDHELRQCAEEIAHPWWMVWRRPRRVAALNLLLAEVKRLQQELAEASHRNYDLVGIIERMGGSK